MSNINLSKIILFTLQTNTDRRESENQFRLDYYDLYMKREGFTTYNPEVNPNILQSVGVAAFRMGHSQIENRFQVIKKPKYESYRFLLRERFVNMVDIWEGNVC